MADFISLQKNLQISDKSFETTCKRFSAVLPQWFAAIDTSFIAGATRHRFKELIRARATRLDLPAG